ncbi:hypothetical protein HDE_12053 [Halotydeus destructor]|nr:hypothetical protein HDE_12053 [Halotydeus destructor]
MHGHVYSGMNALRKEKEPEAENFVWISQYAMIGTLTAVVSILVLYPEKCGYHFKSTRDLEAIIYVWRVIGYQLGIKEKYLLPLSTFDSAKTYLKLMLEREILPCVRNLKNSIPEGRPMALDIIDVMLPATKILPKSSFARYVFEMFEIESEPLTNFKDYFCYYLIRFIHEFCFKYFPFMRTIASATIFKGIRDHKDSLRHDLEKMAPESHDKKYLFKLETVTWLPSTWPKLKLM